MTIVRENVTPVYDNTTMQKLYLDGVHRSYHITPVEGYVLHDNARDYPNMNMKMVLGFTRGTCSCGADYDFDANPREFYAVLESSVPDPENQIFGGGNGHETALPQEGMG